MVTDSPPSPQPRAPAVHPDPLLPREIVTIAGGEVDFESQTIEMLVAFANRAQFWGTGRLNGVAASFRISAVEGSNGSDAFRIELWNAAGTSLLYDTQPGAAQDAPVTTQIEGGKVQIHRG